MVVGLLLGCSATGSPPGAVSVPLPPDLGQPVTVLDAAAGVCVSVQLDRWDADHRAAMVSALQSMGVREVRHDLIWSYVEPSRGAFDWTTEDAWVDAVTDAGFEVIAMTAYGNAWASSDPAADAYFPPDDPADFAAFAGLAAARYGDRIRRYEIWNEPNAGYRFWKVGDPPAISGDPEGYADLFVPASAAIHAAAPGAAVEVGGTFFLPTGIIGGAEFVRDAASWNPHFLTSADAVAYHPYTTYPPRVGPEEDDGDEEAIDAMGADMREASGNALPLSITEAGWPSWGTVDEDLQGALLLRGFALAQADGVRDYCAYTLEDYGDPGNPEGDFGLYRSGAVERKPAGDAWASIAANLDGMDCYGRAESALGLPAGVYAVRWASPEAAATLVWTTSGEQEVTVAESAGLCGAGTVTASEVPTWVQAVRCDASSR